MTDGVLLAEAYNQTVLPLVAGFALLGLAGVAATRWTERGLVPEQS